jgi:hypothetical protein
MSMTVLNEQPADRERDLRTAVLRTGSNNPALQRLQQRVLKSSDASDVITSYDRMHHRHSRS